MLPVIKNLMSIMYFQPLKDAYLPCETDTTIASSPAMELALNFNPSNTY